MAISLKDKIVLITGASAGIGEACAKAFASESTRGVTVNAVVERLIATGTAVFENDGKQIRLVSKRFSPFLSDDETSQLLAGLHAIINLASTVHYNLTCAKEDRDFQRESFTYRLNEENQKKFRKLLVDFLADADNQAKEAMEPFEEKYSSENQLIAGLGFYSCFENSETNN